MKMNTEDLVYIAGQVLYGQIDLASNQARTNLIGAYGEDMLTELFNGIPTPARYQRAYRLSIAAYNSGANQVLAGFNGIDLVGVGTWSGSSFRRAVASAFFFSWTQFPTENALGYSNPGLNLFARCNGGAGSIYSITAHAYFMRTAAVNNYSRVF